MVVHSRCRERSNCAEKDNLHSKTKQIIKARGPVGKGLKQWTSHIEYLGYSLDWFSPLIATAYRDR